MSDVWSYLSGSRRRARSKASLDPQSSCCISDTTAPGSPSLGLDLSVKYGSLAATSDGRGGASLLDGAGSASLDHVDLLSPATASSLAASSSLFSPTTAPSELPPASLRTSASLRGSYASTSWVASSHGGPDDGHGNIGTTPAAELPQQHAVPEPAANDAASQASNMEQREPENDAPPQQDPSNNNMQPAAGQAASPLSEWGSYKTPSGSRQPTQDHTVDGESPQRVANLSAWPAGSVGPNVRRSSGQVSRSSTRHHRTSSSLQPETADVGSTAAARRGSSTAAADAGTPPIANHRRSSLASLRSALRSRRGSVHSTTVSSTGPAVAHSAADGSADGKAGPLHSLRQSAASERSSHSGELQRRTKEAHVSCIRRCWPWHVKSDLCAHPTYR